MKLKTDNKSSAAEKAKIVGLKKWIIEDMKTQYSKRDVCNLYLKVIHSELTYRLCPIEFDILDQKVRQQVNGLIHKKYLIQCKKLKSLVSNSNVLLDKEHKKFSDITFFDRFYNLSQTQFNIKETNLLSKGLNYNLKPIINKSNLEYLAVETELALSESNDRVAKHIASNIIKNQKFTDNFNNNEYKLINDINKKIEDNNLIFTRADKGKTVIAISKVDYISKTLNFLDPDKYRILKKDPTQSYQTQTINALKNAPSILNKYEINNFLRVMNPQPPKLYSLIKLHKEDFPIRPVVSYVTAPATKLSKTLVDIIIKHTKFKPHYSIKNSLELINKTKDINLPNNAKLLSFDIKNLFPSVPPNEVFLLIKENLEHNNVNPIIKDEILQLLSVCLNQNYFQFNNNIYTCDEGLIMGNPLSPILAEIFVDNLENTIFKNKKFSNNVFFWHRYVDDILLCYTGSNRQLDLFIDYINSLHRNISFTLEKEVNNNINFLDLNIKRINNKLQFSIYRKESFTDITIHNSSTHPLQHKLAAYYSMIHRLIRVPMTEGDYEKEVNIIKEIAYNNGYNPYMIDRMLYKKVLDKTINEIYPNIKDNKNNKFKTITYLGLHNNKLSKFFKKEKINIAYRTNNNLAKFIKNNKDRITKENKSGVYKLDCGSCSKLYIGQSGRAFKKRVQEHCNSFSNKKTDSTYANHLLDENHILDNNFTILHIENKGKKLDLLEALEINKRKNSGKLLNEQTDLNFSPLLQLFT